MKFRFVIDNYTEIYFNLIKVLHNKTEFHNTELLFCFEERFYTFIARRFCYEESSHIRGNYAAINTP